jgi:hypothetical protein
MTIQTHLVGIVTTSGSFLGFRFKSIWYRYVLGGSVGVGNIWTGFDDDYIKRKL